MLNMAALILPTAFYYATAKLLLLLCFIFGGYRLARALRSPTRTVPGPFWARFTRMWLLIQVQKGNFEATNLALHEKYGPVVRIAPSEFSVDDPNAIKIIYGHSTQFIKSPWYLSSGFPDPDHLPNLFSDRNIKRHSENRRKVAATYAMSAVLTMESHVSDCATIFLDKLKDFAKDGKVIDMTHWLRCFAFDVVGIMTYGVRFGFLDDGKDHGGIFAAIDKFAEYSAIIGVVPEYHRMLFKGLQMLNGEGGISFIRQFAETRARHLYEKGVFRDGDGKDFLSKLLKMHEDDPRKITMDDVMGTCTANIVAGSDTTSISLASILNHLLRNPGTMVKLRREIQETQGSETCCEDLSFKIVQQMPYFQAVVKEALRLHPATGLILGRVVPAGGAEVAGLYWSEGTVLGVNTWVAHKNRGVYGADAASFRPERWLEDLDRVALMDRYYFPFGLGSRTCIGKNLSLMEIAKIIPRLVWDFDFELINASEYSTKNMFFVKQENFNCKIHVRHPLRTRT